MDSFIQIHSFVHSFPSSGLVPGTPGERKIGAGRALKDKRGVQSGVGRRRRGENRCSWQESQVSKAGSEGDSVPV